MVEQDDQLQVPIGSGAGNKAHAPLIGCPELCAQKRATYRWQRRAGGRPRLHLYATRRAGNGAEVQTAERYLPAEDAQVTELPSAWHPQQGKDVWENVV